MTLPKMETYHVTGASRHVALWIDFILSFSHASGDTNTQQSSVLVLFPTVRMPCTAFYYPNPTAGALYRICPSLHAAACFCDIHCALSPTPQGSFPCCEGCIVGQGMFVLWEINQMEQEMCSYLEWQLSVDPLMLHDFQAHV